MNPWHPARDQAEAERLYRMVGNFADRPLLHFINQGWTLATLLAQRHAEAIPQPPKLPPAGDTSMPPAAPSTPQPSDIAQSVVDQVLSRDAHGQRKYGVSLDRTDFDTPAWLQHMAEELMDGAHYALAAKREIVRRSKQQNESVANAMSRAQDQAKALLSTDEYNGVYRFINVFWRLYNEELSK